ncbi:MAG TPA: hypothetical protein PK971_16330, partial [Saprospiraceae bacterium]|nr:hypothetical protein [Saprospiraceae bacterium]
MQNGDTINPGKPRDISEWTGYPSVTGGMAVPAPGMPNCYYLVHTSIHKDFDTKNLFPILYWSLVDMNQNGGLGKVVSKNNIMATGELPSPVIIKHGNGRDWWVLVGDYQNRVYKTILIDPAGVHADQVQAITPEAFESGSAFHEISPDGTVFVNNEAGGWGLWLYRFDRCTGQLYDPKLLPYPMASPPFSNAFSADGRFLYLGGLRTVYQLDMQTLDSTEVRLDAIAAFDAGFSPTPPYYTYFLLPELAADGKIYYEHYGGSLSYHVIHRPDQPGLAADFEHRGQAIPRWRNGTWCFFPNYRLGRWNESPCDTLSFRPPSDGKFQHHTWTRGGDNRAVGPPKILKISLALPNRASVPSDPPGPITPALLVQRQMAEIKHSPPAAEINSVEKGNCLACSHFAQKRPAFVHISPL